MGEPIIESAEDIPDLARKALAHDEEAMKALIDRFAREIRIACRRWRGPDYDDAVQECLAVLWESLLPVFAAPDFPGNHAAFALTAFRRRLIVIARDTSRLKRGGGATISPIIDVDPASDCDDPARIVEDREAADQMLDQILDLASPTARRAIPLLIAGSSAAECDRLLGLAPRSTSQAIRILRNRLDLATAVIEQISEAGEVIGSFSTAAEAARATGIEERGIGKVLRGEMFRCGGFGWRRRKRNLDEIAAAEGDAIERAFVSAASPPRRRQLHY